MILRTPGGSPSIAYLEGLISPDSQSTSSLLARGAHECPSDRTRTINADGSYRRCPSLDSEGARALPLALGGLTGGDDALVLTDNGTRRIRRSRSGGPGKDVSWSVRRGPSERERGEVRPHGRGRRGPGGGGRVGLGRPSSAAGCVTRRNGTAVGVEWTGASLVDDGYAVIRGASPKYENDEGTSRPGAHTNATINSLKWDGEESQPTYQLVTHCPNTAPSFGIQ